MKKLFKISLCLIFTFAFFGKPEVSKAQGWGEVVIPAVIYGVKEVSNRWSKEILWYIGGAKHTWWYVQFENGVVIYDNPRSYRTPEEILNSVLTGGAGCDWYYYNTNGQPVSICDFARSDYLTYYWGKVSGMGYQTSNGMWRSVAK